MADTQKVNPTTGIRVSPGLCPSPNATGDTTPSVCYTADDPDRVPH